MQELHMSEYSPRKSTPEAQAAHQARAARIEEKFTEAGGEKLGKAMGDFARRTTSAAHQALEEQAGMLRAFTNATRRKKASPGRAP
jgi:hypothetical protein